jgi:hypothetical protein
MMNMIALTTDDSFLMNQMDFEEHHPAGPLHHKYKPNQDLYWQKMDEFPHHKQETHHLGGISDRMRHRQKTSTTWLLSWNSWNTIGISMPHHS